VLKLNDLEKGEIYGKKSKGIFEFKAKGFAERIFEFGRKQGYGLHTFSS
jgi:hypothetical protein